MNLFDCRSLLNLVGVNSAVRNITVHEQSE